MPTYEYACRACGEHLEVVQSFTDDPLTTCPACGGQLRKVFSPVGIAFKGSGFYKTDSRGSGRKRDSDGEKSEKSADKAAKSSDSSSDSKPAAASDSRAKPEGKGKATEAKTA